MQMGVLLYKSAVDFFSVVLCQHLLPTVADFFSRHMETTDVKSKVAIDHKQQAHMHNYIDICSKALQQCSLVADR